MEGATWGANVRAVADVVGHVDPGFTLRVYAKSNSEMRKEAVQAATSAPKLRRKAT
jgi:hypothetical protein